MLREPQELQSHVTPSSTLTDPATYPQFARRLFELALIRVNESTWTRLFALTVVVQAILIIVLEALILFAHSAQAAAILATDTPTFQNESWSQTHVNPGATQAIAAPGGFHNVTGADPYLYPEDRLTRLQYENIFFMCFQIWMLYFGIDSIVRQNLIQVIAQVIINFLCTIFAGIQISETLKWRGIVQAIDREYLEEENSTDLTHFTVAVKYEIGLTGSLLLFTLLLAFFTRKLYQQFGWNVYKRIGADLTLQNGFRIYQIFVILIKIDAFFQLVFAIFWLVVMVETDYLTQGDILQKIWFGVHTAVTMFDIPALFLARIAIKNESSILAALFLFFEVIVAADFCIIIQQSSSQWGFWVAAVCFAILFSIVTCIYVVICTGNFNKGLKPYIQRMFDTNYRLNADPTNNPALGTNANWQIDDLSRGPSVRRPWHTSSDDAQNAPDRSNVVDVNSQNEKTELEA